MTGVLCSLAHSTTLATPELDKHPPLAKTALAPNMTLPTLDMTAKTVSSGINTDSILFSANVFTKLCASSMSLGYPSVTNTVKVLFASALIKNCNTVSEVGVAVNNTSFSWMRSAAIFSSSSLTFEISSIKSSIPWMMMDLMSSFCFFVCTWRFFFVFCVVVSKSNIESIIGVLSVEFSVSISSSTNANTLSTIFPGMTSRGRALWRMTPTLRRSVMRSYGFVHSAAEITLIKRCATSNAMALSPVICSRFICATSGSTMDRMSGVSNSDIVGSSMWTV